VKTGRLKRKAWGTEKFPSKTLGGNKSEWTTHRKVGKVILTQTRNNFKK